MACDSLVSLPRQCNPEGLIAGSEELFIIAYKDLAPVSGTPGTPVYTVTAGIVSAIGLVTGKDFVNVGILRDTVGATEELTKSLTNGTAYFTQTIPLVLAGVSVANQQFLISVLMQPVAIIIKTRNGEYVAAGLNGQLELTATTGGTGVAAGDTTGYTLTFTGIDSKPMPLVDPTLIPTIIAG